MSTLERLGEDVSDLVAGADVFEHHLARLDAVADEEVPGSDMPSPATVAATVDSQLDRRRVVFIDNGRRHVEPMLLQVKARPNNLWREVGNGNNLGLGR